VAERIRSLTFDGETYDVGPRLPQVLRFPDTYVEAGSQGDSPREHFVISVLAFQAST
jgi:hypothetical protein